MTKEQALKELHEAAADFDTEAAHCDADNILCEFLKSEGHDDLVRIYDSIKKWYS